MHLDAHKYSPFELQRNGDLLEGLLAAEGQIYYPHDFRVGQSINVWGRKLVIYDCRSADGLDHPADFSPMDPMDPMVMLR